MKLYSNLRPRIIRARINRKIRAGVLIAGQPKTGKKLGIYQMVLCKMDLEYKRLGSGGCPFHNLVYS